MILGTLLPWFSLFAGLQPYRGTTGLYGRLVFAGGVMAIVWDRASTPGEPDLAVRGGVLGVLLLGFVGWLGVGLYEVLCGLAANPLLVAKPEAGLPVAALGAVLVAATLLIRSAPTRQ